jgi:hypothetical protein
MTTLSKQTTKIIIFFSIMTFVTQITVSCGSLSQNFIKTGKLKLNGGMQEKAKWDDSLIFDRYSWFHELTLMYEVMIADYNLRSPFSNWLSQSQKRSISECASFKILMVYTLDSSKISKRSAMSSLEKRGYKQISISDFKDSLRLHPDVENLSLQLYDIYGYCKNTPPLGTPIAVNVPSYPEVLIK